ncbi:unnamed protein product [Heligmosomoides polygyrus]|uniref:FecR domain-containing protein n=1 Tax=Heligmosomoides polygyrus TaxID=6339 RepID=A0A183FZS8_HELPZ|nr:unnamed protein product [Heligmosomoides polygyrus]
MAVSSAQVFNQDAAPIQITSNGDTQLHFAVGDPIGIVARRAGLRVQSGSDAASQVFDATARQCVPRIKAVHRSHGPSSDKPSAQMRSLFFTVGLLAVAAVAFAEEQEEKVEKVELSETGLAVLEKLRALRKEEEDALTSIDNDEDREIITAILKAKIEGAGEIDETVREKRAVNRRAARRRAVNRRRFARRLRRNQRRAAQKRRAHARRHQRNLRRAANKIRRLQARRG